MIVFEEAAEKMAEGGMVTPLPTAPIPTQQISTDSDITDVAAQRLSTPGLPQGTEIEGVGVP